MSNKAVPNLISLSRIAFLWPIYIYFPAYPLAVLLLFIAAALTDWLDGFIARWLDAESELGAILDPICDKFLYIGTLWILSRELPIYWTLILTVLPETLLIAIRFPPLKNLLNPKIPATPVGKFKAGLQYFATILIMLWFITEIPSTVVIGIIIANTAVAFSWWSLWSHFLRK